MSFKRFFLEILLLLTISLIPFTVFAACAPVINADTESYFIAGNGANIATPSDLNYASKSYAELAEIIQASSNAYFSSFGYQFVLNGPTDGFSSAICYKLYINGKLWPFGGDNASFTQQCGAYFYPMGWNTRDDGTSRACPNGYTLNTSQGKCYLNDPQLKICPSSNKEKAPPQYCGTGNPINHVNGTKYAAETDILSNANLGFEFKRFYSHSQSGATLASHFGKSWSHTFNRLLSISPLNGATVPASLEVVRDDGNRITYRLNTGVYTSSPDEVNTLANVSGTWVYNDNENGNTEYYDNNGKLLKITSISGLTKILTYIDSTGNKYPATAPDCLVSLPAGSINPVNALRCITNETGVQLGFGYDTINRIRSVTDPTGNSYSYQYDDTLSSGGERNNALSLLSVTYPDSFTKSYLYGEAANVSSTPNSGISYGTALTGIIDENGKRFATYKYDNSGRAYSTEHAAGAEKFTINYVTNSTNDVLYSTVTDPVGSVRTFNFDTVLGTIKSAGQNQPAGSGCSAAASNLTYDANGNVASRTDFNGNMTTYVYDLTRNLETSRTEGLTSTGATTTATRTITTSWHATWRLPLVITEYTGATASGTALKKTTYVYDTKGNITSYKEEDPVRSLSRTTTTTYTYSTVAPGLVVQKVVDGPRTDISDITTYNYFDANASCAASASASTATNLGCRGQLQTITNALGQVTTFNRYNHHGQVEQMTDPNGTVTTNTYDLRQRLLTRTITGTGITAQTTTLTYDNAGQITQLKMPDNSTLNYTYDDAHRLTQLQDTLGNKIVYTLDAAGNSTAEKTYDLSGTLAKTLIRSYDALNRLQTLTGKE